MRRATSAATAYVVVVGAVAACGFAGESTALILLAYVVALPTGMAALVGYYLAYGLLALLPGTAGSSGDPATWFTLATALVGVLAPVVAALVNLALLRLLLRRRRVGPAPVPVPGPVDDDSPFGVPGC